MSKQVFSSCPSYLVEYEIVEDQFHIHAQIWEWNKKTLRAGYRELVALKKFAKSLGYDRMYSISPNPAFCELYCGKSLGEQNGYEVMVWDL